jgi:hypothetical protein
VPEVFREARLKSHTPLLVSDAELDPQNFQLQAE